LYEAGRIHGCVGSSDLPKSDVLFVGGPDVPASAVHELEEGSVNGPVRLACAFVETSPDSAVEEFDETNVVVEFAVEEDGGSGLDAEVEFSLL